MDLNSIAIVVGLIATMLASMLAVVRFVDKKWENRFNDLRCQIDEKMAGCQKLCDNDMKHMAEDIKLVKEKLDKIWNGIEEKTGK